MPKKYAEVLAAVNNMPEAKRKAEEDAALVAKVQGLEDYKAAPIREERFFHRVNTSWNLYDNLSLIDQVPQKLKAELQSFSDACKTLARLEGNNKPSEEEYNAALKTLGNLQNFLTREENGTTVYELLQRCYEVEEKKAKTGKAKNGYKVGLDYRDIKYYGEDLCEYIDVPFSRMAVEEAVENTKKERENKRLEAYNNTEEEKRFPVSSVRLGAQLLKMEMLQKRTKINDLIQKIDDKLEELENTADVHEVEKYAGLDKVREQADNIRFATSATAYKYRKPENKLTVDVFTPIEEVAKTFLKTLNTFKRTSPEAYKELCADYEKELRNANYEDAQEIIDELDLKEIVPDAEGNEIEVEAQEKKANVWIEEIKAENAFAKLNPETNRMELDPDQIAKVLVIRDLANAERGDAKNLNGCTLKETQIRSAARELKKDQIFQNFIKKLNDDPVKYRAALSAASTGHCGGLDDMFKAYVKQLPAGQMSNATPLKRYLPTVLERIEILQKQAKKKPALGAAAAAETIALRNIVRAQRDAKSRLNKNIPTSKSDLLGREIKALKDDKNLTAYLGTERVQSLLQKGHGGKMLENVRLHVYTGQEEGKEIGRKATDVLLESTIAGRIDDIKTAAAKCRTELYYLEPGTDKEQKAMEMTKVLIGEYLVHCLPYVNANAKEKWSENYGTLSRGEVVWSDVEKKIMKINQNETFKKLTDNLDHDGALAILRDMNEKPPREFMLKHMGLDKEQEGAEIKTGAVNQGNPESLIKK